MTVSAFWDSTPREFYNRQIGHYEKENRARRDAWEMTRWQTVWLLNIQLGKDKRLTPRDLTIFPWEKEEGKGEQMSPEVMEKVIAAMDRDAKKEANK